LEVAVNRILTIAGSDSGGGAGIQADLKTITVVGGFGMSVITALTAQNTVGVSDIHPVPTAFVANQLDAVLSDIGADAVKTGMLFNSETIDVVAHKLAAYGIEKVVVDPVMVAKGGDVLLVAEARETLIAKLLPMAFVVTPNIPEAEVLTGRSIHTREDMREAARAIYAMGARYVVVKGGHLKGPAVDCVFDGESFAELSKPRIDTPHTHGTGCVFSAALATHMGMGLGVMEAIEKAKDFIHAAIRFGLPLGKGHGPANPYAGFIREKERYEVLEALKSGLARLQEVAAGNVVPEVQSNLGYALPFAETFQDVAAFPGRLVRLGKEVVSLMGPAFGASRHIATIILTAMRHDPASRSAMNVRFSEERVKRCRTLGWRVSSFDRGDEPRAVKEQEGSSLEWGTESVLSAEKGIPDIIFDRGDVGKEPMIRVLGRTPEEVVKKVLSLVAS
jgi:hydroxymethylpyrimidine kinase/phosphomethylpyrimidine kinase